MKTKNIRKNRRRVEDLNAPVVNSKLPVERLKDGGYISWPDDIQLAKANPLHDGIRVGRTKDGGFIAFPA